MNKIKKITISILLVICIFFVCSDVYADDNLKCVYGDFFTVEKVWWFGTKYKWSYKDNGDGTAGNPHKNIIKVYNQLSTGAMHHLDTSKYNFSINNGFINCATIYYYKDCHDRGSLEGGWICNYYIGPNADVFDDGTSKNLNYVKSVEAGVDDSNFTIAEDISSSSSITPCTDTVSDLETTLNQIVTDFQSTVAQYKAEAKEKFNFDDINNWSEDEYDEYVKEMLGEESDGTGGKYGQLVTETLEKISTASNSISDDCKTQDVLDKIEDAISKVEGNTVIKSYLNLLALDAYNNTNDSSWQSKIETNNNNFTAIQNSITLAKTEVIDSYQSAIDYNSEDFDCVSILSDDLIEVISEIIFWIKIIVPVLLIIFAFVDFAPVLVSDDKDGLKKASSKFIRRCVIAIIIFFIPTLLTWLINIFNSVSGSNISDLISCGIE